MKRLLLCILDSDFDSDKSDEFNSLKNHLFNELTDFNGSINEKIICNDQN